MNKTTNYQLNQWEPTDQVRRTDFNEDNAKIDAAIAAAAFGNCRVEYGSYVGTGLYGDTAGTETVLHLGYQPKLLFVKGPGGCGIFMWPSTSATNLYSGAGGNSLTVTWLEDGLQWRLSNKNQKTASEQLNTASTYYYVAFH